MEISFKDILNITKKYAVLILVVATAFAVVTFGITHFFIPPKYTSSTKLYVETTLSSTQSNYNALNSINYAKSLVPTYIEILETTKFYTQVAVALDDEFTPYEISSKVSFKVIEDTEVFEVIVIDENPAQAKLIADNVSATATKSFSEFNKNATLKVVDEATLPKAPSSPNTTKNVLVAFAVSLVLSLIFVFSKELLDTKIKYTPEMNEILGIPVISAIPSFDEISIDSIIQQ